MRVPSLPTDLATLPKKYCHVTEKLFVNAKIFFALFCQIPAEKLSCMSASRKRGKSNGVGSSGSGGSNGKKPRKNPVPQHLASEKMHSLGEVSSAAMR